MLMFCCFLNLRFVWQESQTDNRLVKPPPSSQPYIVSVSDRVGQKTLGRISYNQIGDINEPSEYLTIFTQKERKKYTKKK